MVKPIHPKYCLILLDYIKTDNCNKLCLRNSFTTSVKQFNSKIKNNNYDLIVSF